jgi:hypothetical protein
MPEEDFCASVRFILVVEPQRQGVEMQREERLEGRWAGGVWHEPNARAGAEEDVYFVTQWELCASEPPERACVWYVQQEPGFTGEAELQLFVASLEVSHSFVVELLFDLAAWHVEARVVDKRVRAQKNVVIEVEVAVEVEVRRADEDGSLF